MLGCRDNLGSNVQTLSAHQGNLNGESVVAANLSSHMEVSYCTSGFFIAKPAKQFC